MKPNICIDCGTPCEGKRCQKCAWKSNSGCFRKGITPWNKGKKSTCPPWNKGLTKETDGRVASYTKNSGITRKGMKRSKPVTEEQRILLSNRMIGDKNPAKRPEVKAKISETLKKYYKEHPEALENRKPSGKNQYSDYCTDIESKIANVLDGWNISYSHNEKIGRYHADFVILDKIVIECDGEYWHKDKQKDKIKDDYYFDRGYFVFRFDGTRIFESPEECVEGLLSIMNNMGEEVINDIMGQRWCFTGAYVR